MDLFTDCSLAPSLIHYVPSDCSRWAKYRGGGDLVVFAVKHNDIAVDLKRLPLSVYNARVRGFHKVITAICGSHQQV